MLSSAPLRKSRDKADVGTKIHVIATTAPLLQLIQRQLG
jgi:hypothetical protein